MVSIAEVGARWLYTGSDVDACLLHDPVLGVRFQPNCSSEIKLPETEWVSNHFNECGYRTAEPCGPKPANTLRVALIGSSIAFGMYVPYPQSVSAVLARDLTEACGQPVEVQNLASEYVFWDRLYQRFQLATQLKPDAVVVVAGPTDVMYENDAIDKPGEQPKPDLLTQLRSLLPDFRLRVVAEHMMYRDPALYLSLYKNSPAKTVYMQDPLGPYAMAHVQAYGDLLSHFHAQMDGKPLPVVLAYVPQRAQVGFAADPQRPAALDPFALDKALGKVAAQDGLAFVDTTPDFVADPLQMDLFLRFDGHVAKPGDGVIGRSIARAVGHLSPFQHCGVSG